MKRKIVVLMTRTMCLRGGGCAMQALRRAGSTHMIDI